MRCSSDRSSLQLQFNGALYLGSLLLLALAVVGAIVVADRIVRPLGTLIGARAQQRAATCRCA
jgi:two-component system nitrogen regulation sensor histidine kinase NtrY